MISSSSSSNSIISSNIVIGESYVCVDLHV